MKIAYIYGSKVPKKEADTLQVINNISSLSKNGLDIKLILPKTIHNLFISNTKLSKFIAKYYNIEHKFINIRTIFTLPIYFMHIGRFFHDPVAVIYSKFYNYDYIYTRDLIAVFWARIFKVKVIFETYRRFYSDKPIFFKLFYKLVKNNIKAIVTHSNIARNDLIDGGVNPNIIRTFHNGYNEYNFAKKLSIHKAKEILNIDKNKNIITYTGKISFKKGLESIIKMAEILKDFDFYLIGSVDIKTEKRIKETTKGQNFTNLKLLSYMPQHKLVNYLYASKFLLIPIANDAFQNKKTVLPIKTFQYLAAGRVIIAPYQEDIKEVLTNMNNSILINNNINDAIESIKKLNSDDSLYKTLSNNALNDSKKYTWDQRSNKIIDWFKDILL